MGNGAGFASALNQAGHLGFAPLNVQLAPYALRIPQRESPDRKILDTPPQTAASLDNLGEEAGLPANSSLQSDPASPSAVGPVAGVPLLNYYPPEELSRRARILRDIDPFLGDLNDHPGTGKAVITLWINEQGGVDRAETETSDLTESFENAVLEQFLAARFQPAERAGLPVKSLMRIEVEILPRSRFSNSVE